jgi:hypothetical protein
VEVDVVEEAEWREKLERRGIARYAHFDYHISLESCIDRIKDPKYVAKHAYYPFLHYELTNRKLITREDEKGKHGDKVRNTDRKRRNIKYAAHIDSWIYRYYAYLINEKYNERVIADGINEVSVAYRNCFPGKNNINFAHSAFSFIKNEKDCLIIIGDFKDFFETLNHKYLKKQLKELLGVEELSDDYYSVFKAITHYSYIDIKKILEYRGLETNKKGLRELNRISAPIMTVEELREKAKEKGFITKNENKDEHGSRGVPQGSPISAVLANVYMLEVDKQIYDFCKKHNGFYMRYSDDFMVVIPGIHFKDYDDEYVKPIRKMLQDVYVTLEPQKTQTYQKEGNCITNLNSDKKIINFLGFSYDGNEVRIRAKTISKYYHKLYRKVKGCYSNDGKTKYGTKKGKTNLYKLYSYKGSKYYKKAKGKYEEGDQSNFLDYVHKASKIFEEEPITKDTRNHMSTIKKAIRMNEGYDDDKTKAEKNT